MIRKTQRGIWETDVKTLDLKKPRALNWYVEKKIHAGDWQALDRQTLTKVLPDLKIEPSLRDLLESFLLSHVISHHRTKKSAVRRRAK